MRDDPFAMAPQDYQRLYAEVVVGAEARAFLDSDIGRYLVACALAERDEAVRLFARVSPADVAAVAAIQARINRLDDMERWIKGAIERGAQAFTQLQDVTIDGDAEHDPT